MTAGEFAFAFATHDPNVARQHKIEVATRVPELRFAFSRPGITTWKSPTPLSLDYRLPVAFQRLSGVSLGKASSVEEVLVLGQRLELPLAIHVSARPESEGTNFGPAADLDELRSLLEKSFSEKAGTTVAPGDWILDVVIPNRDAAGEPWLVGVHRHSATDAPHPGGAKRVIPPERAPSRAYAKIEEALAWSGLPCSPGETVLELGAAPGGAAFALLERGMNVYALDPADLADDLGPPAGTSVPRLVHLKKPAASLVKTDLDRPIDWLLCDMNLAPQVALREVARAAALTRRTLRGAVITLKMNDERAVRALPRLETELSKLGLGRPRLRQLPSHRTEVVAVLGPQRP